MDVAEDAEGSLDPRIQIELENLNNATDDINKLETELDEAHTAFRQLLSESTRRLKEVADKLGATCIEKARCYFEALEVARLAQVECQKEAQLFQRASEIHAAAKETVALAEARFTSHQHEWKFDQAWQDMLNHATIKVMDAENKKAECGREHHRKAMVFQEAEKKLLQLEEKYRRYIIKSRPYFEVKAQCDQMLATQKERVEYLQKAIKDAKHNYASSLRILEDISNQIHQQRKDNDILANGPREPGVGAELIGFGDSLQYKTAFKEVKHDNIISTTIDSEYHKNSQEQRDNDYVENDVTASGVEHLSRRSVDGSEATSNQWELELQASMEKLNCAAFNSKDFPRDESDIKDILCDKDLVDKKDTVAKNLQYNFLKSEESPKHALEISKTSFDKPSVSSSRSLQSLYHSLLNSVQARSKININNITKSFHKEPIDKADRPIKEVVANRIPETNFSDKKSQRNIEENTQHVKHNYSMPKFDHSIGFGGLVKANVYVKNPHLKGLSTPTCYSANSSPLKSINIRSRGKNPHLERLRERSSSIKELPLLSLVNIPTTVFQTYKERSSSMNDLKL